MKLLRRIAFVFLVLFLLIAIAYVALPWKAWVQHQLIAILEKQGLAPVTLAVDGVGLRGLKLKEIAIGEPAHRMDHLAVAYSPFALLAGDMHAPVTLTSDAIALRAGDAAITIGSVSAHLTRGESWKLWKGSWTASDIAIKDAGLTLPLLAAKGTLALDKKMLRVTSEFADATKAYQASVALNYALDGEGASQLNIAEAKMPWGGGEVALTNATVPIGSKKPTALRINVRKVNVESLLQALGAQGATATGVVSGNVPLTVLPNGTLRVGAGALNAAEPGIITLPPEVIPGDNPQVNLVREVMKNLHYNVLALSLASDKDGNLLVKLGVEGKNPDAAGGRPIKLNVQLSGDLLNLLLQNIKLMTDPKTFIEQNGHETNP